MQIETISLKYAFKEEGLCRENLLTHRKVLPYLSVVQAQSGSYDIRLGNGDKFSTGAGGFFIAPSNIRQTITHCLNAGTEMKMRWVFLDVLINDTYSFDTLYDFPVILDKEQGIALNNLFDRLFSAENVFREYACYHEILGEVFKYGKLKEGCENAVARHTMEYIKENYTDKISVADLAANVNMSESNFYAVFRKLFGSSPIAWINQYRISLASELLKQTDDSVEAIAFRVGINDPIYFRKLFARSFNASPGRFRKEQRSL